MNKICFIFWGAITKMAIKLSIIDIDPYIIPYSKANILRHAVKLKLGYCHTCGLFSSHFNWFNPSSCKGSGGDFHPPRLKKKHPKTTENWTKKYISAPNSFPEIADKKIGVGYTKY